AMLPLHVFEPRYVRMVEDLARTGEVRIVMGLFRPDWEESYFERPPVHEIGGLGTVLQINPAGKDRFNILVKGVSRARLLEEPPSSLPYRQVHTEEIPERILASEAECRELRERLRKGLIDFADGSLALMTDASLAYLADILTVALPLDIQIRQEIFAILEVSERARRVLAHLKEIHARRRSLKLSGDREQAAPWN
ncbi:MAG: LON peptidase substrate-binding domain-containing protein, partial [Planctomycetota bacterium]